MIIITMFKRYLIQFVFLKDIIMIKIVKRLWNVLQVIRNFIIIKRIIIGKYALIMAVGYALRAQRRLS